jgi:RND family efflux transporter MFP subunit
MRASLPRPALAWCATIMALGCGKEPAARSGAHALESAASSAVDDSSLVMADTATLQTPLELSAQLYVEHDATIYARSSGIVQAIHVDLGTRVIEGQQLARLESADQQIALAQADERLGNSRLNLDRQRALKTAGVVTEADSERVEFEHREALLAHRKALRDLDLTRITAPFPGVVTARRARIHRLVNAGDTLFRVTALGPILAGVHVPEALAASLPIGAEAEITGIRGVTAGARIIRASPTIDPASGTREMILQLSKASHLTPGSSVTVRLGSEPRRVVTIPRTAVDEEGYALVWSAEGATPRPLTLGSEVPGDRVEVVAGLAPGEKVVRDRP